MINSSIVMVVCEMYVGEVIVRFVLDYMQVFCCCVLHRYSEGKSEELMGQMELLRDQKVSCCA